MSSAIDDYDIQALVDGELDDKKAKQLVKEMERNPSIKKRYDELCEQRQRLKRWWKSLH